MKKSKVAIIVFLGQWAFFEKNQQDCKDFTFTYCNIINVVIGVNSAANKLFTNLQLNPKSSLSHIFSKKNLLNSSKMQLFIND